MQAQSNCTIDYHETTINVMTDDPPTEAHLSLQECVEKVENKINKTYHKDMDRQQNMS